METNFHPIILCFIYAYVSTPYEKFVRPLWLRYICKYWQETIIDGVYLEFILRTCVYHSEYTMYVHHAHTHDMMTGFL